MKASALIKLLQQRIDKYGDLPIVGGYILDDTVPTDVVPIDDDGADATENITGFFLQ